MMGISSHEMSWAEEKRKKFILYRNLCVLFFLYRPFMNPSMDVGTYNTCNTQ